MTLFLFPNLLSDEGDHRDFLPASVDRAVSTIDGLIAESEKGARAYLRRFSFSAPKTFRDIPIRLLNEHTRSEELVDLLSPLLKGETWGLISDCGLPCLADPGATLVKQAREKGIKIEAFVGPSSLILALMLSGLPAQRFAFHGYLDRDPRKQISHLEKRAKEEKATQLFIEAPYRSQKLLEQLIATLSSSTMLCVAWDLTMPSQQVISQSVAKWKIGPTPILEKHPTVFLIY